MRRERAKESDKKTKKKINRVTFELFVGIYKNSGLENKIVFEERLTDLPIKLSFQYT